MKTTGRKIAYGTALLLLAFGIFFCVASLKLRHDFHEWEKARPVDMKIDLSETGEFSAPFLQTCTAAHSEMLCLALSPNGESSHNESNLLSEVRFTCRILNSNGSERLRQEFTGETLWQNNLFDGAIPLISLPLFEKGTYTVIITVTQPAIAFRGVLQRINARYMLCGLEMLPAHLSMILGFIAMILAALISGITFFVVRRKEKSHAP
jgi:hypothetical protein